MEPLYDYPLYRPPAEAESLILQATLGCSFNRCRFCAMYRSKEYHARPLEELLCEIRDAAADWPGARRVFLADGDALALPTEHLVVLLHALREKLPQLSRVSCYATPANLRTKGHEELTLLREHGLKLLYVGIESGDDEILRRATKGATRRTIIAALQRAHEAGLKVSATVILGLGGEALSRQHIEGTLALLGEAPVNYLSTLQLHLDESVIEEFTSVFAPDFRRMNDQGMLQELRRLVAEIAPPRPVIFRSDHASNALALAGSLPRDRARLLAEIDAALAGATLLRPQALRRM